MEKQSDKNIISKDIKKLNEEMNLELTSIKNVFIENLLSIDKNTKDSIRNQNILLEKQLKENKLQMEVFKKELSSTMKSYNSDLTQKCNLVYSAIEAQNRKIERINLSFVDKPEGKYLCYTDIYGKNTNALIKEAKDKYTPDGETLICREDGKVSLAHKFNEKDFKIKNNEINVTGFLLGNGNHISADRIHDDLTIALYSTKSLSYKVENIIKKLNTINGYIASNNFKKENPSQESLTNFALSCLSSVDSSFEMSKENIPNGTKIKNTFDNHIWVFNHFTLKGLTTYKWEDFGADNLCLANNSGVQGLVAGSQEKYRGYIDVRGVISINGLEEELNSILNSIKSLSFSLESYIKDTNLRFATIEEKIKNLEG